MKTNVKNRLKILERAFDKASKFEPGQIGVLAEFESIVLLNSIRWSKSLAEPKRLARRNAIWKHFGWNTPEAQKKYQQMLERIRDGRQV